MTHVKPMYSMESIQFQGHSSSSLDKCSAKMEVKLFLYIPNTTCRRLALLLEILTSTFCRLSAVVPASQSILGLSCVWSWLARLPTNTLTKSFESKPSLVQDVKVSYNIMYALICTFGTSNPPPPPPPPPCPSHVPLTLHSHHFVC